MGNGAPVPLPPCSWFLPTGLFADASACLMHAFSDRRFDEEGTLREMHFPGSGGSPRAKAGRGGGYRGCRHSAPSGQRCGTGRHPCALHEALRCAAVRCGATARRRSVFSRRALLACVRRWRGSKANIANPGINNPYCITGGGAFLLLPTRSSAKPWSCERIGPPPPPSPPHCILVCKANVAAGANIPRSVRAVHGVLPEGHGWLVGTVGMGRQLDWMILAVFSSRNDPMICHPKRSGGGYPEGDGVALGSPRSLPAAGAPLLQNGEAGEPSARPRSRHRLSAAPHYNGMWFDPKWEGLALYTVYLHTLV